MTNIFIAEHDQIFALLSKWILRQLTSEQLSWLRQKQQQIASDSSGRALFFAFSAVSRFIGKENLQLEETDIQELAKENICWFPQYWTMDRAVRIWLLLSFAFNSQEQYSKVIKQLFDTADVRELTALYQALPFLPNPQKHYYIATEGVRSNMTDVFNAISLYNSYPAAYFDELAWNQMVLKALFVGSPLYMIQGLEQRANLALAKMLVDYAHERWVANRSISPELWQIVGRFVDTATFAKIGKVFNATHRFGKAEGSPKEFPYPKVYPLGSVKAALKDS